ncbi:MAG: protein containing prepilin-type N- cleavage/methylation domain protein [Helicobacteraceae bacterium CG2_30_36_10]|nr:MAG: protein containing prepilin-type N- cleavage/methylation domain protein [Helicobacteraceae bacterium CG2_30_36_10]
MRRIGFTMIELIFVIVIMGIIGKFGTEFLAQAYKSFIFSSINNKLQADSEMAVTTVASRLQYRIKDSVIGKKSSDNSFLAIGSATGSDFNILEWVGSDIEGFRGDSLPLWSGIIDLDDSNATLLDSPETNTTALNAQIGILSHASGTGINNAALYFVGSDSDINNYGWDFADTAFTDQSKVMHPIKTGATPNLLIPKDASTGADNNFTGIDVFEYYQLAWTAYAVGISDYNATGNNTGTLMLYYDYQPWEGEEYNNINAKSEILMENVSTFQFKSVGSLLKIQVCVNSDVVEDYSLCKEKTIF